MTCVSSSFCHQLIFSHNNPNSVITIIAVPAFVVLRFSVCSMESCGIFVSNLTGMSCPCFISMLIHGVMPP